MTWTSLDDKLGPKVTKSHGLEKELDEVKASLLKESDEHDTLHIAVQLVCDDLKLAPEQETSSFAVLAARITDRVHEVVREALCFGVHRSFAIARSHYENIDLATMSQGFAPGYSDVELENIEKEVAPLAQDLPTEIEDGITPQEIS